MGKKNKSVKKIADQHSASAVGIPKGKPATLASGSNSMTHWFVVLCLVLPLLISTQAMDPALTLRYIFISGFIFLFIAFFFAIKKLPVNVFDFPTIIKAVFVSAIAFLGWSILCSRSSINVAASYYELVRQALNVLLLWLIVQMVNQEELQLAKLCRALVIVSLIQSFVGIAQYYDIAFTEIPGSNAKPFGLMANRNLFGSAQVYLLPFVLFALYKATGRPWKYACISAIAGIAVSVLLSQTRAAWLGTIAIAVVSLILIFLFSPSDRRKWIIGTITGVGVTVLLTTFILATDPEGDLSKSVAQRAASLTSFSSSDTSMAMGNAKERMNIWKKTFEMIRAHPIAGVGPGNWKIAVPSYGTKGLVWSKGQYVPDWPHNVYLHLLSETGIPGAILYFGTWILIAICGFKLLTKPQPHDRRILVILMIAGLSAFAIDCLFSFPTSRIEHSLYSFLMAGIIMGCSVNSSANLNNDALPSKKNSALDKKLLVLFLLAAILNLFLAFAKYNFEVHMNYAKAYENANRFTEVIDEVKSGKSAFVTLDPNGYPLEVRSGMAYGELKQYDQALKEMNKGIHYNPNNAMIYNNIGTIYTNMQQFDKAIENYNKALQLTPEFDIVLKNLAINYSYKGNDSACVAILSSVNISGDTAMTHFLSESRKRLAATKHN